MDGTFPTGLATGEFNDAVDQQFKIPYAIQYSLGVQRELPGNYLLEVSYVGRQARKLFTQADASQALNFKDPTSGQLMFDAFNALQAGSTADQPWFENQVNAALIANFGGNCVALTGGSCTALVAGFVPNEIENGDTSDAIFAMYGQGLLNPNAGEGRSEVPLLGRIAAGTPVEAIAGQDTLAFGDFAGDPNIYAVPGSG